MRTRAVADPAHPDRRLPARGHAAWPTPVTVTLSNYRFNPSIILLQPGRPYRLHLVNTSTRGTISSPPPSLPPPGRRRGAIEVEPGRSVDLAIVAPAAGNYPVKCTHFTHALRGMTGWVIVK